MKITTLKSIQKIETEDRIRYDMGVEDNHNYFANEMLVHNCSATFAYVNKTFYVCSRNRVIWKGPLNKVRKANSTWLRTAVDMKMDKKMKDISSSWRGDIFIQGELAGPGIQGNKYKFEKLRFFAFNLFIQPDEIRGTFIPAPIRLLDAFNIKTVPVVGNITISENDNVASFEKMSTAESVFGNTLREGIVVRPVDLERGREGTGPVLGFKYVSPEFLLHYDC